MATINDVYGHLKTLTKKWFYDKTEVDNKLSNKQNTLISGTNLKTINNTSLLGSGNITITGGNEDLSNYLQRSDVKDNLTSTDTNKPLSAKQGKELKTLIDGKANSTHSHSDLSQSIQNLGQTISGLAEVATSGDYDDLINTPENLSDFNDDVGYLTSHQNISGKENISNKVTSISSSSTDTQYPSAKVVKDNLDLKVDKQEDSLITVTNGNIILSDYHTKDRWTNEGASGGGITSTTLTSGSQGNVLYVYNFPPSVTSVTMNFLSIIPSNIYITNGEGVEMASINNFSTYTWTATSDEGLGIRIDDPNKQVTYAVTSITFNMDNWIDKIYPIGATYISTVEIEPSTLFGGVWERIKDRFLLSSGDTYANASTGGEATHTLTTNEMPSHTHIQNSHNHTQNSHNHTQNSHNHALTGSKSVGLQEGSKLRVGYGSTSDSKNTNNTTATNKATTATNQSATATNQSTGGGQAHNNMPPYLVVYMWKRVA